MYKIKRIKIFHLNYPQLITKTIQLQATKQIYNYFHNHIQRTLQMILQRDQQIANIFNAIDSQKAQFYSTRPIFVAKSTTCLCHQAQKDNNQELLFYKSQRNIITHAANSFLQFSPTEDQQIFAKILLISVDYIDRILQFLTQTNLCSCNIKAIQEAQYIRKKNQFLREENDKFFKLYQQTSEQSQRLKLLLTELQAVVQVDVDIRPITTRKNDNGKENQPIYQKNSQMSFPCSMHYTVTSKSKCSQISDSMLKPVKNVMSSAQRDHRLYFQPEHKNKQRKSKIFEQNTKQRLKN